MKSLSELTDSQSVKPDVGEMIDRGSTAEGPNLNPGDLRRVLRTRRYARLRSYFADGMGNWTTPKGFTLLAPAKPADSKCKLFNSLSEVEIDEREDVISWS